MAAISKKIYVLSLQRKMIRKKITISEFIRPIAGNN